VDTVYIGFCLYFCFCMFIHQHACVKHTILVCSLLRPMAHDPSSPSNLLLPESRTRNLEAIAHVLFCPSSNLVPECMTDVQSYWHEISSTSNLDGELGSCAMGLSKLHTSVSWALAWGFLDFQPTLATCLTMKHTASHFVVPNFTCIGSVL